MGISETQEKSDDPANLGQDKNREEIAHWHVDQSFV